MNKNNQANSDALFILGSAEGSRLDARSVTAGLKSLDGFSVANRPAIVKSQSFLDTTDARWEGQIP